MPPSGPRISRRNVPPGRGSISRTVLVNPFGPQNCARCLGSVNSLKTSSRGASNVRATTMTRSSDGLASVAAAMALILSCDRRLPLPRDVRGHRPSRRHEDHPWHAEAVGNQAEARGKEGLGQRHPHLPAVGQGSKQPLGLGSDSEKPWKFGCPVHRPSDANKVVSPMRKLICITLSSEPGEHMPGSGLSLKRMSIVTSAPSALR